MRADDRLKSLIVFLPVDIDELQRIARISICSQDFGRNICCPIIARTHASVCWYRLFWSMVVQESGACEVFEKKKQQHISHVEGKQQCPNDYSLVGLFVDRSPTASSEPYLRPRTKVC